MIRDRRLKITPAPLESQPASPILLRLTLHRWRIRVLAFTQCGERPERYGEPSRFDTTPSQPSLQASRNTIAPSFSKCSFRTILRCDPRNSLASNSFRFSIGSRRKSRPSNSSKSNAQCTALASAPWRRIKSNTASPFSLQTMASEGQEDHCRVHRSAAKLLTRDEARRIAANIAKLQWAGEATTANEREAYIKFAEIWLQSALRSERLSKEPIPTTEYDWVLPPLKNGGAKPLHSNEKVFRPIRSVL
jgi:hypothetical protein